MLQLSLSHYQHRTEPVLPAQEARSQLTVPCSAGGCCRDVHRIGSESNLKIGSGSDLIKIFFSSRAGYKCMKFQQKSLTFSDYTFFDCTETNPGECHHRTACASGDCAGLGSVVVAANFPFNFELFHSARAMKHQL